MIDRRSVWTCGECLTDYAIKLTRCPRCNGTEFSERVAMPKITRHEGPSNVTDVPLVPDTDIEAEPVDVPEPSVETDTTGTDAVITESTPTFGPNVYSSPPSQTVRRARR